MLAVIGGPTGAGKSTLVNSLVRAPVSVTGILRPTTRTPTLVCHPRSWARVHRHGLIPISAPALPANVALIDAPDINSVDQANRDLANELFDDADLWLFVTTAARYADAEAWRHLRAAQQRKVDLAVVLDRVPPQAVEEIVPHLSELLGEPVPLFVVPDSQLDRQGMLPERVVTPVWEYLQKCAAHKVADNVADMSGPTKGGD
jgi:energy-coupling factor transporter ATP-binding protein EcfA2